MQWITDNWLLLLIGGGMIAMHLFGHGGHGGHGSHGSHGGKSGGRDHAGHKEAGKSKGCSEAPEKEDGTPGRKA